MFPFISLAGNSRPELYCPKAIPETVHTGPQPDGHPLILSVRTKGPVGQVSAIVVNLSDLVGAKYYDPGSNAILDISVDTPMQKVYEIEGDEAYLIETGSRYEYNIYRKSLTHEKVRGAAVATNKWQVELPHAGNIKSIFSLGVNATNIINHPGSSSISLRVVDDCLAPEVTTEACFAISSPSTRAGDSVTIKASVIDDYSGVFSVRLIEDGAESLFGENPNIQLTRQVNSDIWEVQNIVAMHTRSGFYNLQIAAVDRAGNESVETVGIRVTEKIPSFSIELKQGWNLISVPRALENPAVSEVFEGLPVESVQTVIGSQRMEVVEIEPGIGYLVEATADATLTVQLADYDVSAIPLAIKFEEGWNLMGYASWTLEPAMPLIFYLGDDLKDEWLIAYTEDGAQARTKSTTPYVWATDSFDTVNGEPYSADTSENLPAVQLGKGYWLYLADEGVLIP